MVRIVGGGRLARHLGIRSNGADLTSELLRAADRTRTEYIDRVNEGGGTGPNHVASLPGQAPNTDTGRLVGSVVARRIARNRAETSVEAVYGLPLEMGTDKMAPRPALGPSFDHLKPSVIQNLERALRNG